MGHLFEKFNIYIPELLHMCPTMCSCHTDNCSFHRVTAPSHRYSCFEVHSSRRWPLPTWKPWQSCNNDSWWCVPRCMCFLLKRCSPYDRPLSVCRSIYRHNFFSFPWATSGEAHSLLERCSARSINSFHPNFPQLSFMLNELILIISIAEEATCGGPAWAYGKLALIIRLKSSIPKWRPTPLTSVFFFFTKSSTVLWEVGLEQTQTLPPPSRQGSSPVNALRGRRPKQNWGNPALVL